MGKIISIHSFRGGTGKSNTCANLAAQAALAGKRVAVVDTDIFSPGIHVLFGLDENSMGRTLNEFLRGECSIEEVAYSIGEHEYSQPGLAQLSGKPFWLLPASINQMEISRILKSGFDVNLLNKGLSTLRRSLQLDYLFLDTHPGLNEETLLSILLSDTLVIILRPDQQDFQGTAVTVDIARSLDAPNMQMLVNKALTKYDRNQVAEQVIQTYHAPVAGVLPMSEDMADLGSADLFTLCYPDHPWSVALRQAAANILA